MQRHVAILHSWILTIEKTFGGNAEICRLLENKESFVMRKSLIEINRPETKRFCDYRQLADHLNEVKDSSEWTIVRAEDTSFDGESGANTFEAMGGDEFSCVSVSFDEGVTQIPLRYTALTSILNRCEVSGDGIKKLFLADKVYFAKHVNRYLSLKENAKRQMLALVQDGKLSAIHSNAYTPIEQTEVFALVENYLKDYDDAQFLTAEWSWEQTQAMYEIHDSDLLKVNKYVLHTRNIKNEATGQWEKVPYYSVVENKFPYGHGEGSVWLIERFIRLSVEESIIIRWHMGGFDDAAKGYDLSAAFRQYPNAMLLHIADMKATYLLDR